MKAAASPIVPDYPVDYAIKPWNLLREKSLHLSALEVVRAELASCVNVLALSGVPDGRLLRESRLLAGLFEEGKPEVWFPEVYTIGDIDTAANTYAAEAKSRRQS